MSDSRAENALFPVWFLTWRKNDRVAFLVMNGETGKISADLPVDIRRFLLGSAAVRPGTIRTSTPG